MKAFKGNGDLVELQGCGENERFLFSETRNSYEGAVSMSTKNRFGQSSSRSPKNEDNRSDSAKKAFKYFSSPNSSLKTSRNQLLNASST